MRSVFVALGLLTTGVTFTQDWHSERIGGISAKEAASRYAGAFPEAVKNRDETSGISLHKVTYWSSDGLKNRKVTALVAVPELRQAKGLVVYFQGTNLERALSPSRYTGGNRNSSIEQPVLAFCDAGFAVAIPDTFGLGDDTEPHPYPLGSVNCQTGIDLVPLARTIAKPGTDALYVTGYSEGGGTAMWMVRKLEETGQTVTAAVPMSGPYDLKGTMLDWILGDTSNLRNLAFKYVAASYGAVGIGSRTGMSLTHMLKPSYASYVPFVFGQDLVTEEIGKKLLLKGFEYGSFHSIERVLQPDFKAQLRRRDSHNAFVSAFEENDVYAWTPKTPMILPYLPNDEIVPAKNTLLAAVYMEGTGYVRPMAILGSDLDHVKAARPAMLMAARFFQTGFSGLKAWYPSVSGTVTYRERIALPASAVLEISLLDENGLVVATTSRLAGPRQAPIPYRLNYRRKQVVLGYRYSLRAEIKSARKVLLRTLVPVPVSAEEARGRVDLRLVKA